MDHADALHLTFLGATETVTGSRFLIEGEQGRVLVDCGLYQGVKHLRRRNWEPFPVPADTIDAVVVTHAHIDHTGYLPRLVREGFSGKIHCTGGTADLLHVLLPDAAHLQEEDARHANLRGSSKHHPALPLYEQRDAEAALGRLRPTRWGQDLEVAPGLAARFEPVGHILGAATISVTDGHRTIGFTGDVGRPGDPIMRDPAPMQACDHLVCESTYGNRRHPPVAALEELAEVVARTLGRGGSLVIPSFAVGRAQEVLHLLARLRHGGRLPDVPIYLDSPMAIDASEIFADSAGDHRLGPDEVAAMFDGVTLTRTPDESRDIAARPGPAIIVSASGMATGGRVLHHLERLAPDRRATILFVGFQAAGTRGEAMLAGAREIKVFGAYVPVHAEVAVLDGLSAHADAIELCDWLAASDIAPQRVSVVHGEAAAADNLRRLLSERLGWRAEVARYRQTVLVR